MNYTTIEQLLQKHELEKIVPRLETYRLPETLGFYRYLTPELLGRKVGNYRHILNALHTEASQIVDALMICCERSLIHFDEFMEAIPWVLVAGGELQYAEIKYSETRRIAKIDKEILEDKLESYVARLDEEIEALESFLEILEEFEHEDEERRPIPIADEFVSGLHNLESGDIVVSFDDTPTSFGDNRIHLGVFRIAAVESPMVDFYTMSVRQLTPDERKQDERILDLLPRLDSCSSHRADWLGYGWAMRYDTYVIYCEHKDIIDEHIHVLERAGYNVPMGLRALKQNFSN